jgi:2-oxoglutarate/2-oxoacid ferredoxin oxidoreductase subunit alpha
MNTKLINQISMQVATVNGSGSQSANLILLRAIFRMGIPVGGKNLFPSNIAGLPTWFVIRANEKGYTAIETHSDVMIAMNSQTVDEDFSRVKKGGFFIYNSTLKLTVETQEHTVMLPIDFNAITGKVSTSIKLRKLLANIVYVGVMAELLGIPDDILQETIAHQFGDKKSVVDINIAASTAGREYAREHITHFFPYTLEKRDLNKGKMLAEGNATAALGAVYGGATLFPWYPITPSSSVAENFERYCYKLRRTDEGKHKYSIIQAEDELSAITMVAGGGWAGARSMTATSGPGISLMAETVGMMYFAEIPGVIWNIQRAGPSTGLPTRTQQGDILSCAMLSHGDTRHPLLFPATPKECFEMAQTAFDIAERMQTLVFVMSDLDLGMNHWVCDEIIYSEKPYDRGKILDAKALEKMERFKRYEDVDGDGIPYRTLPGTESDKAGYFTRGTGHDESAKYTENPIVFKNLLERLDRKWQTAKTFMPKPEVDDSSNAEIGLIAYGTTDLCVRELRDTLAAENIPTNYMRLRSFPFTDEVEAFIKKHKKIIVLEQNRDGQMRRLLCQEYPEIAGRLKSELLYDGWPVRSQLFAEGIIHGQL